MIFIDEFLLIVWCYFLTTSICTFYIITGLNIIVVDAFMVLTYCWVLCYKQLFTQRPNKKLSIAPIFWSYLFTIMLLQTVAGCDRLKQIILN